MALTDGGSPSLFANVAVVRRPLTDAGWHEAVIRMNAFYAGAGGGPYLVFSAWPTPDLTFLDFRPIGHPPLMFRPAAPLDVEPVAGLEVRRVTDAETARDWETTLIDGFPLIELSPAQPGCMLPPRAVDAGTWLHWVGYLHGRPVGTASASVGTHHVDVEFIATLESARGRGIGRALTATATVADPTLPAMLVASDMGRPVYDRLGYLTLLRFTLWAGHRHA